jgi:hypothetical protein
MLRGFLARLLLVGRPPRIPIRDLGRWYQALFVIGVGVATITGFAVAVVVLYTLGLAGVIDSQANSTGDFALVLWVVSTYLLGLATTDWVRKRAIGSDRVRTTRARR